MIESTAIPKHWQIKKLGEVGEIVSGGTPSTKVDEYWNGKISWISPADLSGYLEKFILRGRKSITESGLKNSSARLVPKGSVLFSSRAPIGYVVIAGNAVCTNQGFKSIVPNKSILSDYLFYYLKASKQKAEKVASGTTFKEISLKAFSRLEIPLPPIPEQHAIVSKIEELLSELENGKQQLQTAQKQLKVYRQSLLKWAFEGRLNYDSSDLYYEYDSKNKIKNNQVNHTKQKNHSSDNLPKGWKIAELKDVISILGDGLHGTPKYSDDGDYFFINGNNLGDGRITIKGSTKRASVEEYEKYKKQLNDKTILVSINGTLGNVAFYNNEKVILGKSACYFNVLDFINKNYVKLVLSGQQFQNYAQITATGSTIKNVSLQSMREFKFPLPPLEEQQLIVNELESRLTVCDKIEETISKSLQQAETLRQSILKTAFVGKLIKLKE